MQINELEQALNSYDLSTRMAALTELAVLAERGDVACEPERPLVNMHCHTCFSFNAYGYSPAGLAWLAKQRGFEAVRHRRLRRA